MNKQKFKMYLEFEIGRIQGYLDEGTSKYKEEDEAQLEVYKSLLKMTNEGYFNTNGK